MLSRAWVMWIGLPVWWTLNGLVLATEVRSLGDRFGSWEVALTYGLGSSWTWVPLTMAAFWLVQRYPIERGRLAMSISIHAGAVLSIIVVRAITHFVLNDWIRWYDELPSFGAVLLQSLFSNFFFGWVLVGVAHALLFAERAHQRERQASELRGHLAQARLQALAAQLNPHFLFNSLNSIAELVHQDPQAAERMLVRLSELLHHSLDTAGGQQIPLREELRLLRHYVEIEHMRLGDRLQLAWNVERNTLHAPVPHLILQPLVENAIRYAVAPRITPTHVCVAAYRRDGCLVLEVTDDGAGTPPTKGNRGIGLANTRARLECLYGKGVQLTLTTDPGGTTARLTIPDRPNLQPAYS
ncbi:MAG: hypothetical protein GEV06_21135 [Luteitalea sp.]|nr:hypothetical protein [Luteitalea sp.]